MTQANNSRTPVRLGWLANSPVYYHAPVYRILAADPRVDFVAIFASDAGMRTPDASYPYRFAAANECLAGYRSYFLKRAATNPMPDSTLSLVDPDVVTLVARQRFDVLVTFGYNSVTHAMAILTQRLSRRPVVLREEQTMLHTRPLVRTIVKELLLRALFAQQRAAYVSSENRRWFEHYGVSPDRLFFAPYSVDNNRLQRSAENLLDAKGSLRQDFGIAPDAGPVILTVSKLIDKKQPLFLLDAFARARSRRRCVLLVVGPGDLEAAMRQKVQGDAIPDVILTGAMPQDRVAKAYAAADIFVLLSRANETFGVVVCEAMNFGLPVVVSDKVGCYSDLVRPMVNGYVVSHTDVVEASAALEELVNDEAQRRRFGAASLRRINEWSPQRTAEGVLAAVADAVGPSRWNAAGPPTVPGSATAPTPR